MLMKKLTLLLFLLPLLIANELRAQAPVNDDCSGLIDLGMAPVCPPDTFTNVNATATDIGFDNNPTCFNGNTAEHDVWFAFTCPDTLFNFRITLTGVGANPITNPEFAIYRGDCTFDGLAELLCGIADNNETGLFIDVTGLTPGVQYFIRVSDWSPTAAANWGDFTLCVAPIPPITNVDEGGSTLCEGTLYDTGGPDGDYGPDEDHTFTICPSTESACITFTLEYFNIEGDDNGGPDYLAFYDGDNTSGTPIATISSLGFSPETVAGGGGVCFQVQASSGCLTLQFHSDGSTQLDGFAGHWECSTEACPTQPTLTVNTNINADTIISAISTPATTVTVTDINCPTGAYGTFTMGADNSNQLGLAKGLILTSGLADLAVGPNNSTFDGFAHSLPGDADLDYLSTQQGNGTPSRDACIVELDVFVATNELSFEYVFGSEEYPEFVNTSFNDIFAFLVSGPGIVGDPNLGGAKNIAVLPGTNDPVQINSVNNLLNWQYYRNNELPVQLIEYDGLTSDSLGVKKSLTARTEVVPCNTYHLKLAIADRQDWSYDSGVFVSEIKGGTPDLAVQFASGIDYFIEDCSGNEDQLIISLSDPLEDVASFIVTVGGTATPGLDYLLNLPPIITFQPGQTQLFFPIQPLSDLLPEGTETITIQLSNNFGCGTVVYKTLTIEIKDNVEVQVNGGDTLFVCLGSTVQLQAQGAVNYFWAPPGAVDNPFIANPTIVNIQEDVALEVTGTISTCVDKDSVYVRVIDPQISVEALTPTNICQGGTVQLQANNNVNNSGLVWTPAAGLSNPNSANPVATPSVTTTYTAQISIAGCTLTDQITINVDTLFFPTLTTTDTTVCQNYPVQLANVLNTTTDYAWTPAAGLDSSTASGPIATPDATTTYTLTATSANNYCSQTASVTVNVVPADVDITGDPYREICFGTTVDLATTANPGGANVTWSPAFYVTNPTGPTTTTKPTLDESITIVASYNINGCTVFDSVRIRVDSLPDQTLRLDPVKPIYCPGDTVYIISPTYEPASFPDIANNWLPFGTQLTPLENWNLVIIATETHTFQRVTTNRACADTASIEVPVGVPPTLTVTANPETICLGQPVELNVTVDPSDEVIKWDDSPDIADPNAAMQTVIPSQIGQVTYSVSTPEADCPTGAAVTVNVAPPPALELANNPTICAGETVVLNTGPAETGVTYTWTATPGTFTSNEANPSVTPTESTTYTVNAAGACSRTETVEVTVASATINAGSDQTICIGESQTLTVAVAGTSGTVTWQPGGATGNTITVTPTETTQYTATLFYGNDCEASDIVTVTVTPGIPNLTLATDPAANDSICEGVPVSLSLQGVPAEATLVWTENNTVLTGQTDTSFTITPSAAAPGVVQYTVLVTDANLCSATQTVAFNLIRCLEVPNVFTPNNDQINDVFTYVLRDGDAQVVEFTVYNRWGQKVFEAQNGEKS